MAQPRKFPQFPLAETPTGNELVLLWQGLGNRRITLDTLKAFFGEGGGGGGFNDVGIGLSIDGDGNPQLGDDLQVIYEIDENYKYLEVFFENLNSTYTSYFYNLSDTENLSSKIAQFFTEQSDGINIFSRISSIIQNDLPTIETYYSIDNERFGLIINQVNGALFYDEINEKGLENAGDYEANFTARSLVTKQWVENDFYPEGFILTTNTVSFNRDNVSGITTARTGDVLVDLTNAKVYGTFTMIHNDATTFGFFLPDGVTPFVMYQTEGTYDDTGDNILDFQFIGNGKVRLSISQPD
jgi:hypothetical protein